MILTEYDVFQKLIHIFGMTLALSCVWAFLLVNGEL